VRVVVVVPAVVDVELVVVGPVELVVLGVVELVVVVPVEVVALGVVELVVVVVVPVVVVDVTAEPVTVIGAETPDAPKELSVTSSVVVSGSTRVRLTVAKPLVNPTLLPVVQSAWAG
jgi:hypothetical protein